jgi:hypothetical protein
MYLKTCRCGKSQKNFKFDIGEFFINKCCKDAGYDVFGQKPKAEPEKPSETLKEEEPPKPTSKKKSSGKKKKKKKTAKKLGFLKKKQRDRIDIDGESTEDGGS